MAARAQSSMDLGLRLKKALAGAGLCPDSAAAGHGVAEFLAALMNSLEDSLNLSMTATYLAVILSFDARPQ